MSSKILPIVGNSPDVNPTQSPAYLSMEDELLSRVDMDVNSIEFYLAHDFPGKTRGFDCQWYDKCLVYAGRKGWDNFTCTRCSRFNRSTSPNTEP